MIDKWFQNDINKVLAVHDRMVVTDALGEGGFLLDYLPSPKDHLLQNGILPTIIHGQKTARKNTKTAL